MDAVFYLLDALRLFRGKSLQEIQEITFEIGMLGKYGLDINDPQETHVLRALSGRVFSALQLICIMHAGLGGSRGWLSRNTAQSLRSQRSSPA